ncbi:hypothetical protein ZYGR_0AD03200 [Zygosaccharomyces rouxii]|uniref:ZYRO0G13420p n=2 Tax=Zygosaccharomyces rouxii TaxID=4956 RepID=C5E0K2_ZYGRC|nr:uncharacterized protein ZYRO0G13420g [Zygosaccharomyces rouxii]KAH9202630.1 hypothetical protein LQ764DRAFT_36080 [Zygosaccharomyces rouxii]GAV51137.1 hypothetical protein ZYGR_0AD03200 [Zygosaccharomyces rouxii]CAR29636.1 ZYRO0G13420p [Zygosaccharomyces rouxii]
MLKDQLLAALSSASYFLSQNDLLTLAQVSRQLHDDFAIKELYRYIHITRDSVNRSELWYLDGGKSYLSGYRAMKKTGDQNDLFLHDRIERLSNSPHLELVEELIVDDDLFTDREVCLPVLRKLLDRLISLNKLRNLEIRDPELFQEYYSRSLELTGLNRITIADTDPITSLGAVSKLNKLKWVLLNSEAKMGSLGSSTRQTLANQLQEAELVADEIKFCSLNLFQYLQKEGIRLNALKSLKLNYTHNIDGYNKSFVEDPVKIISSVVDVGKLEKLELGISCEYDDCGCMDAFMDGLAPKLTSLRELSLIEKTSTETTSHEMKESWDIVVCRFIIRLPSVEKNLKSLSIRHATPLNGLSDNSLPGNYVRRRTLYETVLPKLSSLQKLIAPNILQCLSAYEYLMCDLLWNGCECQSCQKFLPIFDQYLMNHQYYLTSEGRYTDVIPTVFFAYAGDFLMRRFSDQIDWDLDILSVAPLERFWNLHGYEDLRDFVDYECFFDETTSPPLALVISHFFNGYMDHLIQLLPRLKTVVLSGIYYTVDNSHNYTCVYD